MRKREIEKGGEYYLNFGKATVVTLVRVFRKKKRERGLVIDDEA